VTRLGQLPTDDPTERCESENRGIDPANVISNVTVKGSSLLTVSNGVETAELPLTPVL
jgi:hypothetical protein